MHSFGLLGPWNDLLGRFHFMASGVESLGELCRLQWLWLAPEALSCRESGVNRRSCVVFAGRAQNFTN